MGTGTVIERHCGHLARLNRRPGTIYQRRRALERLSRWVSGGNLLDATLDELRDFLDRSQRNGLPLSVSARAAETSHIYGFFRWAVIEGHRPDDPTVRLERPRRVRGLPRPMPDDHVALALTTAESPYREWFYLAAYAGLRACEVAALRGEDRWGEMLIIRDGKGGKPATVPIAPVLRPVIAGLPRHGQWFPHGHDPDRPVTASQLQRRANRWLHEHGIPETFHSLRHVFGTRVYQATHDLLLTRDMMRHASVSSTQGYTLLEHDAGLAALALLPSPA
jgi:integrase/recombinase XerC